MEEEIKDILRPYTSFSLVNITNETNLYIDLELDSFILANIALDIETKYNITIPYDTIFSLYTFGDLVNYIKTEIYNY